MDQKQWNSFYNLHSNNLKPISELSADTKNKDYISDSGRFLCFDGIKNNFFESLKIKSADMIDFVDGKIIFTEFKLGELKSANLALKAYESYTVLSRILKEEGFITDKIKCPLWFVIVCNSNQIPRSPAKKTRDYIRNRGSGDATQHPTRITERIKLSSLFKKQFVIAKEDWQRDRINKGYTSKSH